MTGRRIRAPTRLVMALWHRVVGEAKRGRGCDDHRVAVGDERMVVGVYPEMIALVDARSEMEVLNHRFVYFIASEVRRGKVGEAVVDPSAGVVRGRVSARTGSEARQVAAC